MNIFKKFVSNVFNNLLIGKTYNLIVSIINYIKSSLYINETLYSDEFKLVLKKYLHINIKKDWLGRLYGVINPNIDINGNYDVNNVIIEFDDQNTNTSEFVKTWTYKQLLLISTLFKIENLYNYIDLQFKHVGPVNHDNYLLIFDKVSRLDLVYCLKKFLIHLIIYMIIIAIITVIILY